MKYCNKCKATKSFDCFAMSKARKDKLSIYCKACNNTYKKAWQLSNKDKIAAYDKAWQEKNKDKKAKNYKNWQVNNRDKVNSYNSYRRALELKATPSWLTKEQLNQIESFYWLARLEKERTDDVYHVDHIVPLNGKTVCGLHVPWNLQVLTAVKNLQKSNNI